MKIQIEKQALEDLTYWGTEDRKKALKILELIEDIRKTPFSGLGKPEPLKYKLITLWSRRIDLEHRITYTTEADTIIILSCRYHYSK